MYIAIHWAPIGAADPIEIESEIVAAVERGEFINPLPVRDGLFLADIVAGEDRYQVQELHSALLEACPNKFSYVITVSPNFWALASSPDMPRPQFARIANYET
jgi:hypothetical protein